MTTNRRGESLARVVEALEARGYGPVRRNMARCPAHEGKGPKLSVAEGADGTVVIHCFHQGAAGPTCPATAIVAALGLSLADLFPARRPPRGRPR